MRKICLKISVLSRQELVSAFFNFINALFKIVILSKILIPYLNSNTYTMDDDNPKIYYTSPKTDTLWILELLTTIGLALCVFRNFLHIYYICYMRNYGNAKNRRECCSNICIFLCPTITSFFIIGNMAKNNMIKHTNHTQITNDYNIGLWFSMTWFSTCILDISIAVYWWCISSNNYELHSTHLDSKLPYDYVL